MNDTLGIIGSGRIGGAVARLAVDAGFDVVLSDSRGPETLRALTGRSALPICGDDGAAKEAEPKLWTGFQPVRCPDSGPA
jgi:predicted dinucleotide-binding enzyme